MDTTNKVIGFGTSEAANAPTPKAIKLIYRLCGAGIGIFTAIIIAYPQIPVSIQLNVLKCFGLGTPIVYALCQWFGWVMPTKDNGTS